MPASTSGYEYDIFISYRHNDNLDGWVTDLVQNLEKELRSTVKAPLTIYFDKNPGDGLLETHNVDKTLEGKLKCLIFIPIISQTYCDVKSFAWQHEFCAFNKLSKNDLHGSDIKLGNGNVAGRILPVRIHDLDADDKTTIENEIGGVLRSIEFIYKEPGVNRPLKPSDSKSENHNKTDYRNQVNKLANAIKELAHAATHAAPTSEAPNIRPAIILEKGQVSTRRIKWLVGAVGFVVLMTVVYFIGSTPKASTIPKDQKSLAVLPFLDMSPQHDQEWFSDGLTEELLNSLARLPGLDLIARTSSFAFKGKATPISKIADSLKVAYVLEGSVRKDGNFLRITAQLIQTDKGTHIWSNTYDRTLKDVFAIQEDIAESIAHTLNILLDDEMKATMFSTGTSNVEAYEEYLKGAELFRLAHVSHLDSFLFQANFHFERAIALDKEFAAPYLRHQDFYSHYFIHHIDIHKFIGPGGTDQKIYQQIVNDLGAAIRLEKNPAQRLIYQGEQIVLSSDWKNWPELIEEFKKNDVVHKAPFPGGFYLGLMLVTNPEISLDLMRERLKNDPFNQVASEYIGFSLLKLSRLDSAEQSFKTNQNNGLEWLVDVRREKFTAALAAYEKAELSEGRPVHTLLQLLAGKYNGGLADIHRYLSGRDPEMIDIIFYNALGEYEKADAVAHFYDAKFLGPSSILDFLTDSQLCFRLSATPNLSARLKEAGIDPEQYEKEHYYRFPVVRLAQLASPASVKK